LPDRADVHGESGLRPPPGARILETDAARLQGKGATGVPQRPPERRPPRRPHPRVATRSGTRLQAPELSKRKGIGTMASPLAYELLPFCIYLPASWISRARSEPHIRSRVCTPPARPTRP